MLAAAGHKVVAVDALMVNLGYIHHSLSLANTVHQVKLLHHPVSDTVETLYPVNSDLSNPGATRLLQEHLITEDLQVALGFHFRKLFLSLQIVGPPVNTTTLLKLISFVQADKVILKMDVEGMECKVGYNLFVFPSAYFLDNQLFQESEDI